MQPGQEVEEHRLDEEQSEYRHLLMLVEERRLDEAQSGHRHLTTQLDQEVEERRLDEEQLKHRHQMGQLDQEIEEHRRNSRIERRQYGSRPRLRGRHRRRWHQRPVRGHVPGSPGCVGAGA
jgi:hypothetical protein